MAKDLYTSVMEAQIDQAERYQKLVDKHRLFWATPEGKAQHKRLMAHLEKVGRERSVERAKS